MASQPGPCSSLKITIIGAGISGLATASILRKHTFHHVTILEKHSGGHEVGAALGLGPTAVKIAQDIGFDFKRCRAVKHDRIRTFGPDGKCLLETDMRKVGTGESYLQHRADLWGEWLRLATSTADGLEGRVAEVVWDAEVVEVDVESGTVRLMDGRTFDSDLVVGADGIKSIVRSLVVGEDAFLTARPSGYSAFRFMLPAESVRKVEGGAELLDKSKPPSIDVHLVMDGKNRSAVMYPCRDFGLLNFACIAPDSMIRQQTTESWDAEGSKEDLLRCFDDFNPFVKSLLQHAESVKAWQLRDQDSLPTYIKGRTVLIGDAAHAMTPHQGQGGTQSIEDAEGFVLFNDATIMRETVPDILKNFDRVRRQRASKIQDHTRESQARKSPEDMFKNTMYNYTYPGIKECLRRLDDGEEMIQF